MSDNAQPVVESPDEGLLFEAGTKLFGLVEWVRNASPDLLKNAFRWGPNGDSYTLRQFQCVRGKSNVHPLHLP